MTAGPTIPPTNRRDTIEIAVLFTDLEGSTTLWEIDPSAMEQAMSRHDRTVRSAIEGSGGRVFKTTGDGFLAAFPTVSGAAAAAEAAQRELAEEESGPLGPLRARMAVDVGRVQIRDDDYAGPVLNRCARLLAAGHGGQILVSEDAASRLAADCLVDLGDHRLKGLGRPQRVYQWCPPGTHHEFPDLRVDPSPGAERPGFARTIRGYDLLERLGENDVGIVYRARQRSVGREVAIKIIRASFANLPGFVRRFEAEAQFIAQLEHPHIVSLYDYWRDPDGAYLVMPFLRGGSLRQALQRGPWTPATALRLIEQVGSALSYAHRQGIVHRDIRPSNVLLDDDGNGYLSDFGIASRPLRHNGDRAPAAAGYVSPEEAASEPLTPRSDGYCLGVLTAELMTGREPGDPATAAALPPEIREVVATAIAQQQDDRFDRIDSFVNALQTATGAVSGRAPTPLIVRNPYKGLRPFLEVDARDYHGRDAAVARLTAMLHDRRLVAVVGPSGSGKSSLVRAGLIPALRAGVLPGSATWLVADLYPGSYPFDELAAALTRIATEHPAGLIDEIRHDDRGLARAVKQLLPADDSELVLIIDQFEELFTVVADEAVRRRFLESLVALATDSRGRCRVVLTLRADFFDRPLAYHDFGALLRDGLVSIAAPSPHELAQAVAEPARGVGIDLEQGLVDEIVADVANQPGSLPLMEYALTELFHRRDGVRLTLDGYQATGGVLGALGRRAEDTYRSLDATGRAAARQAFLRLVTIDESADETRRRVPLSELHDLGLDEAALDAVLDEFAAHRLLTYDLDPTTRDPTVEVAHEALLREWGRLADWIREQRDHLLQHRRLKAAWAEWDESGREASYLLTGGRLEQFEAWAESSDLSLTAAERSFLASSRDRANRQRSGRRRVRRMVTLALAVLASVALVFAAVALVQRDRATDNEAVAREQTSLALAEQQRAQDQAAIAEAERARAEVKEREARAREYAAASLASLDADPELSILLALQAIDVTRTEDEPVIREAEEALHRAVNASRLVAAIPVPALTYALDFLGTGTVLLIGGGNEGGAAVEVPSGRPAEFPPFRAASMDVGSSGATVAVGGAAGGISVIDAVTGAGLMSTERYQTVWTEAAGGTFTLSFNGKRTAPLPFDVNSVDLEDALRRLEPLDDVRVIGSGTGADPWLIDVLATTSPVITRFVADGSGLQPEGAGVRVASIGHDDFVADVDLNAAGTLLASISWDGTVRLWDLTAIQLLQEFANGCSGCTTPMDVALSPDGRLLAAGAASSPAVWDLATGEPLPFEFLGHSGNVAALEFLPDGRLVTAGFDSTIRLWDLATGESATLIGHRAPVRTLDVSGDGTLLATGSDDGLIKVWSLDPANPAEPVTLAGHRGRIHRVVFDANSRYLASVAEDTPDWAVRIWDVRPEASSEWTHIRPDDAQFGYSVTFSPDGQRVLAANGTGVAIWDSTTGTKIQSLATPQPASQGGVTAAAYSPDGNRIAVAGLSDTDMAWLRVYDSSTGREQQWLLEKAGVSIAELTFSADGSRLAGCARGSATASGGFWVWDTSNWNRIAATEKLGYSYRSVGLSPDGTFLAAQVMPPSGVPVGVEMWDLTNANLLYQLPHMPTWVGTSEFASDGLRLLTSGGVDGVARIWNTVTGQESVVMRGHQGPVWHAAFDAAGDRVATAGTDGTIRIWDAATGEESLALTTGGGPIAWVEWNQDGTRLASLSEDGSELRVWALDVDDLIGIARNRLTRDLTAEECLRYFAGTCPEP